MASKAEPRDRWAAVGGDIRAYWQDARMVTRHAGHAEQERALRELFRELAPDVGSVLEVGCGRGRIAAMLAEAMPGATYTGLDIGQQQLALTARVRPDGEFIHANLAEWWPARRWDLVVSVECLMHVPPADIEEVAHTLLHAARLYVVACEWVPTTDEVGRPVAPWNWAHEYPDVFRGLTVRADRVGRQRLYLVDKRQEPAEAGS